MRKLFLALVFTIAFCQDGHALVHMTPNAIGEAQEYGIMNYQKDIAEFAKAWSVYEETSKALDETGERAYVYTPYYLVALNARERLLASQTINVVDGEAFLKGYQDILAVNLVLYMADAAIPKDEMFVSVQQGAETVYAYEVEVQAVTVVQTKVLREEIAPAPGKQEDDKKVPDKPEPKGKAKASKKDKKKADKENKDKTDKTDKPTEPVVDKRVFVEKTIPVLHRVQLFVYFDARQLNLQSQATLRVNLGKERERRFRFGFNALR